jgi:indole-3-glycerol phosphate synthase
LRRNRPFLPGLWQAFVERLANELGEDPKMKCITDLKKTSPEKGLARGGPEGSGEEKKYLADAS